MIDKKGFGTTIGLLVAILCGGCAETSLNKLTKTTPQGSQFTIALAQEYLNFANRESSTYYDQFSSHHFARKGLEAAHGTVVAPEALERWRIPAKNRDELAQARDRLLLAINSNAPADHARELAQAQVNFDCWVEELDENHQPQNIEFCRSNYYQAIALAEQKIASISTAKNLLPTAPYAVYYKIGKTDVPPDAQKIIDQLMALVQPMGDYRLVIDGHGDKVGSALRNLAISEQRATHMKTAIVTRGVAQERIRTFGHGATSATGKKGTPRPADRRVDITLFVPEGELLNMGNPPAPMNATPIPPGHQ